MPWSPEDAERFKKGLSPESRRRWASVANSVLSNTNDESRAIRVANSTVKVSAVNRKLKRNIMGEKYGTGSGG